jgi:hypothetical protein
VLRKQPLKRGLGCEVLLEFQQRPEFLECQRAVEMRTLAHQNAFHVEPILNAPGKCFQDHEIFSGTSRDG